VRTTRRRSRTSAWKDAVLADAGPRWIAAPGSPLPSQRPLLVDLGVGNGAATRAWAESHPDAQVLAVELHRPGLAKLVAALDADGPPNVLVLEADALAVLAELDPGSVDAVRVLFPDPWPKRRHLERRLVDGAFVARIAELLVPGGRFEVATDWEDYADHVREVTAAEPRLQPAHPAQRPPRPVTAYEQRGVDAGRRVTDLRYVRSASPG
jgi:tRNA (guanine-N7-)-methyltransferase